MKKNNPPIDATIAVTYRCNSRCRMCNIWKTENPPYLPAEAFYNLSPTLRYVNLSGGEPFLHPDLPGVVGAVTAAAPGAQIIISTNGLATERIAGNMRKILEINPEIGVRISLDGLESTHDRVRGVSGIYRRAMETARRLKAAGVENIGFSFTIMDFNVRELKDVYDKSKTEGFEMALALVQNSDIYFNKGDNRLSNLKVIEDELSYVIGSELKSRRLKNWARAYYDFGLLSYARYGKRLLKSGAGVDSLFIDANGDIFPSNLINLKMGNIMNGRLADIWTGEMAESARRKIAEDRIVESWIICTIRGEMKRHIHKVLFWILRNKVAVSLGLKKKF